MRWVAVFVLSFIFTYLIRFYHAVPGPVHDALPSYFMRFANRELVEWLQSGKGAPPTTVRSHHGLAQEPVLSDLKLAGQCGPGLYPKAVTDTLLAVELYPEDPRGWLVLAWLLDQEGYEDWANHAHMVANNHDAQVPGPLEGVVFWMSVLRMHYRTHRPAADFWSRVGRDSSPELVSFSIVHALREWDATRADRLLATAQERLDSPMPTAYRFEFLLSQGDCMKAAQVVGAVVGRYRADVLKNQATFALGALLQRGELAQAQALAKEFDPGLEWKQILAFLASGQMSGNSLLLRRLFIFNDLVEGRVNQARQDWLALSSGNLPSGERAAMLGTNLEVAGALPPSVEPMEVPISWGEQWEVWDQAAGAYITATSAMNRLLLHRQLVYGVNSGLEQIRALWYSRRDLHPAALSCLSQALTSRMDASTPRGIPCEILARAYWRADAKSKDRARQLLRSSLRELIGPVSLELEYLDKLFAGDVAGATAVAKALFEKGADLRWALFCLWSARLSDPALAKEWETRIRVASRYAGRGLWYIRSMDR